MNTNEDWVQLCIQSTPFEIKQELKTQNVCEAGFVAGLIHKYPEPVSMREALTFLSQYCHVMKRAHLKFENGYTLYVDPSGYYRSSKLSGMTPAAFT